MTLQQTTADEIKQSNDQIDFLLTWSYFDPRYGGMYEDPEKTAWYYFIMDTSEILIEKPVVGVACLTIGYILPNSVHLSIFEVRSDLRKGGIGQRCIKYLLKTLKEIQKFQVITLRLRKPELVKFYSKFGFKLRDSLQGFKYMRKYFN